MGNPWEGPDHTNPVFGSQHHAAPNPTTPYSDPGMAGAGSQGQGWSAPPVTQDPRLVAAYANYRFLWVAILLAICLGPLGVFYVGLLHGLVASVVVLAVGRTVFRVAHAAMRSPLDDVTTVVLGLAVIWGISIPWAIIGARVGNARRGQGG